MPSGKSAWHYMETHRGGDNPVGAQPQACGQLSFQRTLSHLRSIMQAISMPSFRRLAVSGRLVPANPQLPMSFLIGICLSKHYPSLKIGCLPGPSPLSFWAVSYSRGGSILLDVYCGCNPVKLSYVESSRAKFRRMIPCPASKAEPVWQLAACSSCWEAS